LAMVEAAIIGDNEFDGFSLSMTAYFDVFGMKCSRSRARVDLGDKRPDSERWQFNIFAPANNWALSQCAVFPHHGTRLA
jgi:hypothetical protein